MRATRVSPLVIMIVGAVLSLIALGSVIYFLNAPTSEAIKAAQGRYDAAKDDATPAAQAAAKKQVTQAQQQVAQIKNQWAVIERTKMPPYDMSNRFQAWKQLQYELTAYLGPDLERYIKSTGVIPMSTISLPASYGPNPNDITNAPLVIPISGQSGQVQVGGSFQRILNSVLAWNDYHRLVEIDNLALRGNSPYMTAAYTANVIIFPQNPDAPLKPIPTAGQGGAGGAGGGFGGPGGFPGGGYPGAGGGFKGYPGG